MNGGKRKDGPDSSGDDNLKRARTDGSAEKLCTWAKAHGAQVNNLIFREDEEGDRGAYARQSIASNSMIAQIPATLVLSETSARSSRFGARLIDHISSHSNLSDDLSQEGRDPYALGLILLSAFMVYERFENPESFWKPYLESLPTSYELPIWWTEEETDQLLGGTNLKHIVAERKKLLRKGLQIVKNACRDMFSKGSLTWENFLWAYSAVSSRAFPKARSSTADDRQHAAEEAMEVSQGASELCLYPVLDMLNHRRAERLEWVMSDANVTFNALDNIDEGVQVFNNYGAKGNENLLGNYGFLIDPNPEDYLKLALNIHANDPHALQKRSILSRLPYRLVHLLFAGEDETQLPGNLLAVTRLLVMNGPELSEFSEDRALDLPISVRNEVAVLTTLWELLRGRLTQVETGIERIRDSGEENTRRRMARIYREGQLTILRHNVDLCSQSLRNHLHQLSGTAPDDYAKIFLTTANQHLPGCFHAGIESDGDEEIDEDTILCLAICHERLCCRREKKSLWAEWLQQMADKLDVNRILGDQREDVEMHYDEVVKPIACQHQCMGGGDLEDTFVWAAAIMEIRGGNVPEGILPGLNGYGVWMCG